MKRLIVSIVAVMACATGLPAVAGIVHFTAALNGANEAPPNASPGVGTATFDFDDVADTVSIQASFSGLVGTTTAAHIHCCTALPRTGTAGVATTLPSFVGFPLGVTSGSFTLLLDLTSPLSYNPAFVTAHNGMAGARADLLAGMFAGDTYFNVHTTAFPAGEIRGFLQAVPEPWSVALLGIGLLGVAASRTRRRR